MRTKRAVVTFALIYFLAVTTFLGKAADTGKDSRAFTAMCLKNSLPGAEIAVENEEKAERAAEEAEASGKTSLCHERKPLANPVKEAGAPTVIIYHTHSTESYLPAAEGNYHSLEEKNTVREVGDVLSKSLEDAGIKVIHDKTIHDHPSYAGSYTRSSETLAALLTEYPAAALAIDLHRDAIPADGEAATCMVQGKTRAAYFYVLGKNAKNNASNAELVSEFNGTAEKYDGYTGGTIERPYAYNADLCKNGILLEIGCNRNNIEDAKAAAEILGRIIAETLLRK